MADLTTRPLTPHTWPDFASLVELHPGVWGGCWCMAFHPPRGSPPYTAEDNRLAEEQRVRAGTAHAALVYDNDDCVGWCQFGATDELPRIKHRRAYEAGQPEPPDWRITCFFAAKTHRRSGVAGTALRGALLGIAAQRGGVVESCPEDTANRRVSGSFLYDATLAGFEHQGFERVRQLGTTGSSGGLSMRSARDVAARRARALRTGSRSRGGFEHLQVRCGRCALLPVFRWRARQPLTH